MSLNNRAVCSSTSSAVLRRRLACNSARRHSSKVHQRLPARLSTTMTSRKSCKEKESSEETCDKKVKKSTSEDEPKCNKTWSDCANEAIKVTKTAIEPINKILRSINCWLRRTIPVFHWDFKLQVSGWLGRIGFIVLIACFLFGFGLLLAYTFCHFVCHSKGSIINVNHITAPFSKMLSSTPSFQKPLAKNNWWTFWK